MSKVRKIAASFFLLVGLAIAYWQWRVRQQRDRVIKVLAWCSHCKKHFLIDLVPDVEEMRRFFFLITGSVRFCFMILIDSSDRRSYARNSCNQKSKQVYVA